MVYAFPKRPARGREPAEGAADEYTALNIARKDVARSKSEARHAEKWVNFASESRIELFRRQRCVIRGCYARFQLPRVGTFSPSCVLTFFIATPVYAFRRQIKYPDEWV